jgi:hypothetical protein
MEKHYSKTKTMWGNIVAIRSVLKKKLRSKIDKDHFGKKIHKKKKENHVGKHYSNP